MPRSQDKIKHKTFINYQLLKKELMVLQQEVMEEIATALACVPNIKTRLCTQLK